MAKEARSNLDAMSDSRANTNISPVKKASTEEEKNPYAVEKISDTKTDLRGNTTLCDGTATDPKTTRSSPPNISPTLPGRLIAKTTKESK